MELKGCDKPIEEAKICDMEMGFETPMTELLERLTLREIIIPDTVSLNSNPFDGVDFLLKRQEQEDDDLRQQHELDLAQAEQIGRASCRERV